MGACGWGGVTWLQWLCPDVGLWPVDKPVLKSIDKWISSDCEVGHWWQAIALFCALGNNIFVGHTEFQEVVNNDEEHKTVASDKQEVGALSEKKMDLIGIDVKFYI